MQNSIGRDILSEVATIRKDLESCKNEIMTAASVSQNRRTGQEDSHFRSGRIGIESAAHVDVEVATKDDLDKLRALLVRQQSVSNLKDEVSDLQNGMKAQRKKQEDLSGWAEETIASETEELRSYVQQLMQTERDARVAESTEILMVLEAFREGLTRTNAAVEATMEPETLYRILAQSGQMTAYSQALSQHQEQLERVAAASAKLAEEFAAKFEGPSLSSVNTSVANKLEDIAARFDERVDELHHELQKERSIQQGHSVEASDLVSKLSETPLHQAELDVQLEAVREQIEVGLATLSAKMEEEWRCCTEDLLVMRARVEAIERGNENSPSAALDDFEQNSREVAQKLEGLLSRADTADKVAQDLTDKVGHLAVRLDTLEQQDEARASCPCLGTAFAAILTSFEEEKQRKQDHGAEMMMMRGQVKKNLAENLDERLFQRVDLSALSRIEEVCRMNADAVSGVSEKVLELQQQMEAVEVKQRMDMLDALGRGPIPGPGLWQHSSGPLRYNISNHTNSHDSLPSQVVD